MTLRGPRRIAASPGGRLFVVDADARLHMLTPRGDLVATLVDGVRSVTVGGGKVYASSEKAELVTIDASYGRVEGRVALGVGEPPAGISYDAARGLVWMAFRSGMLQARRPDGSVALQVSPAVSGPLVRLVDVAVDSSAGVVWVAQDRNEAGGMIFALSAVDGSRLRTVGVDGTGPARIPGALAVAAGGQLHVADLFGGQVAVVNGDGTALPPIGAGALRQPSGLAFMANGDLLVASMDAGRLERFGTGTPLPSCAGDTDCDGMADDVELAQGMDPNDPRDALGDADGDGLLNSEELALGTNPRAADSDGDGFADGVELASGYDPLDSADHRPAVVAGGASEFAPGLVTLSASVANVADATGCTPAWTQTEGAKVKLRGADGFAPSFVARKAATYAFSVVATCGDLTSPDTTVAVQVVNAAPLADAPRVLVVEARDTVQLSAGDSSDANGDALSFSWQQVAGTAVSAGAEEKAFAVRLGAAGSYSFEVSAADAAGAAGAAETHVVALGKGTVPAVSAISPSVGQVGQRIALDASASHRGDEATFGWSQVSGPPAELQGADAAVAAFVPAAPGRYVFQVVAREGALSSPPAVVEAFVAEAGQELPVAVAAAPAVAPVDAAVTLDGAASTSASGAVAYAWRQVSGPAAGLGSADRALASAYLFSPGSHEFELTVSDGAGVGRPVRVRVEARRKDAAIPVARVKAPARAGVDEKVTLDGRGSSGAKSHRWTQLGGPWVLLEQEAAPSFRPEAPGTYVFELEVDDGKVRSAPARVSVVVSDDGMEN